MEQRISVITLGAENLTRMRPFYEQVLEWKTEEECIPTLPNLNL